MNSSSINKQHSDNSVVFMVGRANPPTPGHIRIMKEVIRIAMEEGAIPRIYLSRSDNILKAKKNITHLTSDSKDCNLRKEPCFAYVKHKNYENPLNPRDKKEFVVDMLMHTMNEENGIDREILNEIVQTDRNCNGTYKAFNCVKNIQPDLTKVIYVLGEEVDENERFQREKNCLHSATNAEHKFQCRTLPREGNDPVISMSGSKVRLVVASKESIENPEEAFASFQDIYKDYLPEERILDLFNSIKKGILTPINLNNTSKVITSKSKRKRTNNTQKSPNSQKGGKSKKIVLRKRKHKTIKTRNKL